MDVVDANKEASIVCHRIADRPVPAVPSMEAVCGLCRARVWLSVETATLVVRLQHEGQVGPAVFVCVPCAKERLDDFKVVVTGDDQLPGAAAAAAAILGIDPATPVINLDKVGRG